MWLWPGRGACGALPLPVPEPWQACRCSTGSNRRGCGRVERPSGPLSGRALAGVERFLISGSGVEAVAIGPGFGRVDPPDGSCDGRRIARFPRAPGHRAQGGSRTSSFSGSTRCRSRWKSSRTTTRLRRTRWRYLRPWPESSCRKISTTSRSRGGRGRGSPSRWRRGGSGQRSCHRRGCSALRERPWLRVSRCATAGATAGSAFILPGRRPLFGRGPRCTLPRQCGGAVPAPDRHRPVRHGPLSAGRSAGRNADSHGVGR